MERNEDRGMYYADQLLVTLRRGVRASIVQGIWYIREWIRRIITLVRDVWRSECEGEYRYFRKCLKCLKVKVVVNDH